MEHGNFPDYLVNFNVQDPTLWEDDDYLKISLYSVDEVKLPEVIQPGSCLLIRNVYVSAVTEITAMPAAPRLLITC